MNRIHNVVRTAAVLLALVAGVVAQAQGGGSGRPIAASSWAFRENKGQWDGRARFLSQTQGLDYWVTNQGVTLDAYRLVNRKVEGTLLDGNGEPIDTNGPFREGHVVRMRFVGGNQTPQVRTAKRQNDVRDYFTSRGHARGTQAYGEATMRNVYRGVDVRHYFDGGKLRFDVVVNPGADPRLVQFRFDGAEGVRIGSDRHLYVGTSIGDVKVSDLFTYQVVNGNKREVSSQFQVSADGTVSFQVGQYDRSKPLVIDPLVYGSYVGSDTNADEFVSGVYADSVGNVYLTGGTSSPFFPINEGPYGRFTPASQDAFLVRMDGDAYSVSYSAVMGGGAGDRGFAIGVQESTGSLWLAGTSSSNDFAGITGGAKGSGTRVWVSRFNVIGNSITTNFVRWRNELGNVDGTNVRFGGLEVSASGSVALYGNSTIDRLLPAGFTNFLSFAIGTTNRAAYVCYLDSAGEYLVRRMIAGTQDVEIGSPPVAPYGTQIPARFNPVAISASGDVVVVGSFTFTGTQDTALTSTPAFGTTAGVFPEDPGRFSGGRLIQNDTSFVVRIRADGTTAFSALLGGAQSDYARSVALDSAGNVYVSGWTNSFNFQRSRGAFDEAFGAARKVFLSKLSSDASTLVYSTGLLTTGVVEPTVVTVDPRGNAVVGGFVSFTPNPVFGGPPEPSTPGSIFTTPDALDGAYEGGTERVDGSNVGTNPGDLSSTNDGFMTYVAPSGSSVIYSSYIGALSDDQVRDAMADSVGAVWFAGSSQATFGFDGGPPKGPLGIAPHITTNAFKSTMPTGQAPGANPQFGGSNGWIVKLRVQLPIVSSISVAPTTVAGGLGATSVATVTLRNPAPAGGVPVTMTLGNSLAASFSPTGSQLSTVVTVLQGATTASVPIFSLPVTTLQTCAVRATLENDFKETTLTVAPWLSQLAVSPNTVVGGTSVTARAQLVQNAPADGIRVQLSTDRPDLVQLPSPAEVFIPAGSNVATAVVNTIGVDASTPTTVTAVFLGVQRSQTLTLRRAALTSFSFNPTSVNGGDATTGTVQLDGLTGTARSVTISQVSGVTGVTVNGQALPVVITLPAQARSVSFTVGTPTVSTPSTVVLRANDGSTTVDGSLTLNDIDITSIIVQPGVDVVSGTRLTCNVRLSRPAGPNGFQVELANSNPAAGTLSVQRVTVPAGAISSPDFSFQCATVSADATTTLTASRTGYTTRTIGITVRAIGATLTITPNTVVGGITDATGTLTLSQAAPNTGITFALTSNDTTSVSIPSQITFTGGQTVRTFLIDTASVPSTRVVTIVADAGSNVRAQAEMTIQPPGVIGLSFSPNNIAIGQSTTGRLTFASPVAPGTVVSLTATPGSALTLPNTLNVPGGVTSFTFQATGNTVADETVVQVRAELGSSNVTSNVTVRRPSVFAISFNPKRVRGSRTATGTITLEQNAPPGGTVVTVTSGNTRIARLAGGSTITIPAGSKTGTFQVNTSRVARTFAVTFTARVGTGTATGTLFVDK